MLCTVLCGCRGHELQAHAAAVSGWPWGLALVQPKSPSLLGLFEPCPAGACERAMLLCVSQECPSSEGTASYHTAHRISPEAAERFLSDQCLPAWPCRCGLSHKLEDEDVVQVCAIATRPCTRNRQAVSFGGLLWSGSWMRAHTEDMCRSTSWPLTPGRQPMHRHAPAFVTKRKCRQTCTNMQIVKKKVQVGDDARGRFSQAAKEYVR